MNSLDFRQPIPINDAVILIVDDVAANRQVLGAVLRKAGYQVLSAVSAHHALQQVNLQVPDLIMLDIMMPGIDGYTLCGKFLADPRTQKIPVIFISSLNEAVDKVKAFESGGVDYVAKPFQAPEVLARVGHHLKISRLQRELEREKTELLRTNKKLIAAQKQTASVFNSLTEILPGLILDGKYRMEAKIGSGGFGVVYRATHLALDREVAIKVFRPPAQVSKFDALSRFQQEGVSTCRVSHPNAVAVLDSGLSAQGIAYLVMELLNGETLYHEMWTKQQLSVERCMQIIVPLLDVLIAAHAADIVHRDIKPENIMLHQAAEGEVVKVLDFGIAKLLAEEPQPQVVTARNELLGTPTYMAPERLDGREYDGRSDVYSVGIMLYEMLTGQAPFGDRDQAHLKVMFNHMHAQPTPLRAYRPDVSESMAAVVLSAMIKDPAQRPTAQTFQDALIDLADGEALPVPTARLAALTATWRGQSQLPPGMPTTRGLQAKKAAEKLALEWNGDESDDFIEIVIKR